jgi:hypothetical protein
VAVIGRLLLLLDLKGGLRAKAAERVVTSARSVKQQRRRNGELSQWVLKAGTRHRTSGSTHAAVGQERTSLKGRRPQVPAGPAFGRSALRRAP